MVRVNPMFCQWSERYIIVDSKDKASHHLLSIFQLVIYLFYDGLHSIDY